MLPGPGGAGSLRIVLLDPVAPPADLTDLDPGLASIAPASNTIVMVSTQPGSAASDGPVDGNLFAKALVRRLAERGTGIEMILQIVRDEVVSQTQSRQVPELVVAPAGVMEFVPSLPVITSNPEVALPESALPPGFDVEPSPPAFPPSFDVKWGGGGATGGAYASDGLPFDYPDAIPLDSPGPESGGGGGYNEPAPAAGDDGVAVAPGSSDEATGPPPTEEEAAPAPVAPSQPQPALPPPPTTGEPTTVEIVRHPTLDAPEEVVADEAFTVSVALTEDQVTPDVTVRAGPGSTVTPENALAFSLPATSEEWPIDIDLLAAGFDLADGGAWSRRVTLYQFGRQRLCTLHLESAQDPRRLQAASADRPALS